MGTIRTATVHIYTMPFFEDILSIENLGYTAPFILYFLVAFPAWIMNITDIPEGCTNLFSSHFLFRSLASASHARTPRRKGQIFFLSVPAGVIPLLNTSRCISSILTLGRPSAANHFCHVFSSIGSRGSLDVLGVGKLTVECSNSNTPSEDVSSAISVDEVGNTCASLLLALSPSSATIRAHRAR